MYCSKCGNEYDGKFCPNCGTPNPKATINSSTIQNSSIPQPTSMPPKKSLFKRWWFWLIIVLIVIIILITITPSKDSDETTATEEHPQTVTTDETENASYENSDYEDSDYEQASFDDFTISQLYEILGSSEDMPFTLPTKSSSFLEEHPDLFPTTTKDSLISFVDSSIEYKMLEKNIDNYGDKLIFLESAYVININEESISDDLSLTQLHATDYDGNSFYIFYFGSLADIYTDDYVNVYGLPIGLTSFSNISGGTTIAAVLAGSYVEKVQSGT